MSDFPLLLFPSSETVGRTKRSRMPTVPHFPDHERQLQRLSPKFSTLRDSWRPDRTTITSSTTGIDPERVIVFEIVGQVEDFANAVSRVPDLEWMGEIELDSILPDSDFYLETDDQKPLKGRLYLISTNRRALDQLLSLWQRYLADPHLRFDHGLTRFREVFKRTKDIRKWNVQDRLADFGIIEAWQEDLKHYGSRPVRFESELWFHTDKKKREESRVSVERLIRELGGTVLSQCVIESIAYQSILGEIPARAAEQIIADQSIDLLRCDDIMFFHPTGQIIRGKEDEEGEFGDCSNIVLSQTVSGNPIIGLLDGYPLTNHILLSGRIILDDPDSRESDYPAANRIHGTAMSSLLIHGDIENSTGPLENPIYCRPVLRPLSSWHSQPAPEEFPGDILLVDYIHRAVLRMFEGENGQQPVAPSIRIINISLGDPNQHYLHHMSAFARLLDWLSYKYNILFIISAGNQNLDINIDISQTDFEALSNTDKEHIIIKNIYENQRHRKILSPAESINGITVGATHEDHSTSEPLGRLLNVFQNECPSPISALGTGHRHSIKPDIVYMGGRVLYNCNPSSGRTVLSQYPRKNNPGIKVAAPSRQPGELNNTKYTCGSSNAAALISRNAAFCYQQLQALLFEAGQERDTERYGIVLLKAMLIHGCRWGQLGENLKTAIRGIESANDMRQLISMWIGFGKPSFDRVFRCTNERATIVGYGELREEEAHAYLLPLPPSLNARRVLRRLTVTLAWHSPIAPSSQKYRASYLWFDFEGGQRSKGELGDKLKVKSIDCDGDATRRGTIQHEIYEGEDAIVIHSGDELKIKVNYKRDAMRVTGPIPYGLFVTFEVAEGTEIPIYNEIRTAILQPVEVTAR